MRGLSHVAMGQFYEGIKAQTKVMLNDPLPGQKASPEYLKVKYLRGESETTVVEFQRGKPGGVLLILSLTSHGQLSITGSREPVRSHPVVSGGI